MPRAAHLIGVFLAVASACGGDYAEEATPANDAGADSPSPPDGGGPGGDADGTTDAADLRAPVTPLSFVLRKFFVGDTRRDGTSSPDAWQDYGRDIDGIASTTNANGECKPHGNATQTRVDGPGGLDNSFGKSFIPLIKALQPTPTADANKAIGDGVRVPMIGLDGNGGFFVHSEKTTTPPTYAFSESRLVAAEWTEVGSGAKSKVVNGGVGSDGFYDSNVLVGPTQIVALIGGTASRPLTIRAARFRMKIAADGLTASEGTLSGVIPTDELVAEMRRFAASVDQDLCNSATLASIEEQIRNASDMMQDGTQDPTRECDGISIGLGFEMTRVVIGAVAAPVAPPANPCP